MLALQSPDARPSGPHYYDAHAFGQRYTLPIPLLLFVLAGTLVVVASFLLVRPRAVPATDVTATGDHVPLEPRRPVLNGLSVLGLVALVVCGLVGSQEVPENLLPTTFWLVVWVAVPLTCGLLGDWTRPVNPLRALARLADSPAVRRRLLGTPEPVAWPRWLSWWPAVATYLFLVGAELVYNLTATVPHVIAAGLVAGALVSLIMGLLFGADAWLDRGELFSVLFSTWGRLGLRRFGAPGRQGYAGGMQVPFEASVARVTFVLMLLASVTFDGLLSTPWWTRVHLHLNGDFRGDAGGEDLFTLSLFVVLVAVTFAVFGGFSAAVARAGGHRIGFVAALAALLPSLAPISFGYLLAHNVDNLSINGQLLIPLLGNPTGLDGGQWLPAPFNDDYEIKLKLIPPAAIWYVAVVAIVLAHVVAVVIAHGYLARRGADEQRARRSEYPWLVAMVAYTALSLWLLAQPLAKEGSSKSATGSAAVRPAAVVVAAVSDR